MLKKADDRLIRTLAALLTEKHIRTESVEQALALICSNFSFNCGLVYEIDQNNRLHLKERSISGKVKLRERFAIEKIKAKYRAQLASDSITYIKKSDENTVFEKELLAFFSATSLLTVSVVDEKERIYGLLVFFNAEGSDALSPDHVDLLATLLAMLGRCISVRTYQNRLTFAQNSLESILDNTGIDIYVNDFYTHEVLYANKSMAAPYGGISRMLGHKCWEVLFPGRTGPCDFCPQTKLIDEEFKPTKVYTWDYQRPFDGSWFRVFSAAFRWVDGRLAHVVSSADITDNKRNEELIQYLANYDALTNLPNRRKLISDCECRISNAQKREKAYILFFDIDGFKSINDTLGHDAGDEFLVQLGTFFSSIPMLKGSIYRNGGDEFVAIISGEINNSQIQNLAGFIHERFKKPWKLQNGEIFSNTSIGVACYPEDGVSPEELLAKADHAMYKVKKSGGGRIGFA